jgi:hypothetical protein
MLQEFHFGFTVLHHHSGCDTYILKVTSCNGALALRSQTALDLPLGLQHILIIVIINNSWAV